MFLNKKKFYVFLTISIIFFIPIVFLFFFEYFFKLDHLKIPHKIFHHTFAPNKVFNNLWGELRYKICTDDNGFRIKCDGNSYKDFDIAFIGDSFTEGLAAFEDTYVGMVVNKFPNLKIVNLGVTSYTPSIYLTKVRYYLEKGITFKRLIVYVDISDIHDELIYSIENGKVKQIAYLDEKENFVSSLSLSRRIKNQLNDYFPITYNALWILKNLILYQKQEEHKETSFRFSRDHARSGWTHDSQIHGYGELGVDGAIKKAVRVMQELHKLTEQYGIKLSVAVYPWPGQVLFDVENSKQVQIWREFCENRCEYFINSFPSIFNLSKEIGKQETINKLYIKDDVHYNYAGNELLYLDFLKVFNKEY